MLASEKCSNNNLFFPSIKLQVIVSKKVKRPCLLQFPVNDMLLENKDYSKLDNKPILHRHHAWAEDSAEQVEVNLLKVRFSRNQKVSSVFQFIVSTLDDSSISYCRKTSRMLFSFLKSRGSRFCTSFLY